MRYPDAMKISPAIGLRALLDIYRGQRKRRHGCLSQRLLEAEWRNTGMRRDDLHRALKDGLLHQLLQKSPHGEYELTYVGEVAMLKGLTLSPIGRLRDWAALRRLRLRCYRPDSRSRRLLRRQEDTGLTPG